MSSYDNHYGVQLLDDIHNYFPAILYEPERFQSVSHLLQYIRSQTRRRFDLFSNADSSYARHLESQRPQPQPQTILTRTSIRPRMEIAPTTVVMDPHDEFNTMSMRLLRELLLPSIGASVQDTALPIYLGTGAMEPVVVRPTPQQIATATTIETVVAEDEMCAICQDRIISGTGARSINACDHTFHTGCIDTWFTTNVRCPVCRHDIREE